jgi:hypothetical protein
MTIDSWRTKAERLFLAINQIVSAVFASPPRCASCCHQGCCQAIGDRRHGDAPASGRFISGRSEALSGREESFERLTLGLPEDVTSKPRGDLVEYVFILIGTLSLR